MGDRIEWARGAGVTVSLNDVLTELKLGTNETLTALLKRKAASALALEHKVAISESELRTSLESFYAERDLFEPEQVQQWLEQLHVDESCVREFIRERLLVERLARVMFTDTAIAAAFGSNPHQYADADVHVFSFGSEGAAEEFILAVREKEIVPFAERIKIMKRDAPEEIAAALFASAPEDLVGPVETDDGLFRVYQLVQVHEAKLDETLRTLIRRELLEELLNSQLERAPRVFLI
jgi:hypothetical protein